MTTWFINLKFIKNIEICTHVLFEMNFKVQITYYSMVEYEFPMCLDSLNQRVCCVEANLREQTKLYGDILNWVLNSNGGSGTKISTNSKHESIPRKNQKNNLVVFSKGVNSGYYRKGVIAPTDKCGRLCDLCAKDSNRSEKTHYINDFLKWNADRIKKHL